MKQLRAMAEGEAPVPGHTVTQEMETRLECRSVLTLNHCARSPVCAGPVWNAEACSKVLHCETPRTGVLLPLSRISGVLLFFVSSCQYSASSWGEADQLNLSHPFTCCRPNFRNKTSRKAWSLPSGSGRPPHHMTGSHTSPCPWPGANGHRRTTYREGTAEPHQLRNCRVQREVLCEMVSHLLVKAESFTLSKVPLSLHTHTHRHTHTHTHTHTHWIIRKMWN